MPTLDAPSEKGRYVNLQSNRCPRRHAHGATNAPAQRPARAAIEQAGARLVFLPPYSPDFNPIEQAFAKLKALLRKAVVRTVAGLETAIATALTAVSPQDCAHYFAHAGYNSI